MSVPVEQVWWAAGTAAPFFGVGIVASWMLFKHARRPKRRGSWSLRLLLLAFLVISCFMRVLVFAAAAGIYAGAGLNFDWRWALIYVLSPLAFYFQFATKNLVVLQLAEMWVKLTSADVPRKRARVSFLRFVAAIFLFVALCALLIPMILAGTVSPDAMALNIYTDVYNICESGLLVVAAVGNLCVGFGLWRAVSQLQLAHGAMRRALTRAGFIVAVCVLSFWARAVVVLLQGHNENDDKAFVIGSPQDFAYLVCIEAVPSLLVLITLALRSPKAKSNISLDGSAFRARSLIDGTVSVSTSLPSPLSHPLLPPV
eukprot:CAMPEP_0114562198 /NCGR_PEP_ID=MMETSP0114-20121206/12397_1 /TAXON_ID=31324 /ORGANISM="Goniomonas sp, Strain m" /LENGTH=313 /DNA_ID=CAMNT_0001747859 /DNA_START=71 /DNA_END=1012 /DNA_ORIENTATION=+